MKNQNKTYVIAKANANIALVKYWGKSDPVLNIPIVPSLSLTLDNMGTTAKASFAVGQQDSLFINRIKNTAAEFIRIKNFLDFVRAYYNLEDYFVIDTLNTVPLGAGLASSASAFASIALALDRLLNLNQSQKDLAVMVRQGSASAARSLFGPFAALNGGENLTSKEAFAYPLESKMQDLSLVVAIVDASKKKVSSTKGMSYAQTSAFFGSFVKENPKDFFAAQKALIKNNFAELGSIIESSTLKMHAVMWTSKPSLIYHQPETLKVIKYLEEIRQEYGPIGFFSMDAGPNVKIFCLKKHQSKILKLFEARFPSIKFLPINAGSGAQIIDEG